MTNPFDLVVFDLDGTLIDSREGIHKSVLHTLREMGIDGADPAILGRFIGPPLVDSFREHFGMSDNEAARAVEIYRAFFPGEGIKLYSVYENVHQLLWMLRASGVAMTLATTKDEVFARQILLEADLLPYFSHVVGSDREGTLLHKPELIAAAISAHTDGSSGDRAERALNDRIAMVGDHPLDIRGARAIGIKAIAVTYGFGDPDELRAEAPDHTVESVDALRTLLLGDG